MQRQQVSPPTSAVFEDERLSFRAKGLIGLLLSNPEGEVVLQNLVARGPDGRTAVESALRELEGCGYIVRREQPRCDHGRFDAGGIFRLASLEAAL